MSPHEETARASHLRVAGEGSVPRLSGDIRHHIPKLGLREYWYPALPDCITLAVTEKRSRAEIDGLVEAFAAQAKHAGLMRFMC